MRSDAPDLRAWRDNGQPPDVCLNVSIDDIDIDVELHLTAAEAPHLALTLFSLAETVEGNT